MIGGDQIEKEKYSFSKIQAFHQCKFQYYQTYILDKDDPQKLKGENNAFAEYGTFCHELLERYAKGELEVYELLDEYKRGFSKAVTKRFPPNKYVDLRDSYYKAGTEFFKNFDGLDSYKILGVEDAFLEDFDGDFLLKGFIDLLYEDPDGTLIVHDWKSKSKFKNKKEEKEFRKQLYTYAFRVYRKLGRYPDVLRFYLFRNQTTVDSDFNEIEFQETMKWIRDSVEEIRKCERWPPTHDTFFCSHLCDYRSSCPYAKGGDKNFNRPRKGGKSKEKIG